jgi:hypothetical protein
LGCDITPSPPNENRDGAGAETGMICASAAEAHAKIEAVLSTDTAFNHILSPSGFKPELAGTVIRDAPMLYHFTVTGYREFQRILSSILPFYTRISR